MNKWLTLAAGIAVAAAIGCGTSGGPPRKTGTEPKAASKKDHSGVVGTYVFKFTHEVDAQLQQNESALQALNQRAATGDKDAGRTLAGIPKGAQPEKTLLAGIKLKLASDKTFDFHLLDRLTGRLREAAGTYAVDDSGAKLTLTFTSVDGKKAEGADAKALTMTFDEEQNTVTGDTGGGPKLVMQKR